MSNMLYLVWVIYWLLHHCLAWKSVQSNKLSWYTPPTVLIMLCNYNYFKTKLGDKLVVEYAQGSANLSYNPYFIHHNVLTGNKWSNIKVWNWLIKEGQKKEL